MIARIQRFAVNALCGNRAAAGQQRRQVATAETSGRGQARFMGQRRQQIDVLRQFLDACAAARRARPLDHQRHADRLVVEKQSVFLFLVIFQSFAVIGSDDDRRLGVPTARAQVREQLADDLVGIRDLAVVFVRLRKPGRRRIRRMRLVDVEEQEDLVAGPGVEPLLRGRERVRAGAKNLRAGAASPLAAGRATSKVEKP